MRSYLALAYLGAFLTAVAQILLKLGAQKTAVRRWYYTYITPFTLAAYGLLFGVTLLNMRAFAVLPFKVAAITLPANYLFVGLLSHLFLGERLKPKQGLGAALIMAGIGLFFL